MFNTNNRAVNPNNSHELPNCPNDTISCLSWAPNLNQGLQLLAASSWDGTLRVWEVHRKQTPTLGQSNVGQQIESQIKAGFQNPVPTLACALSKDGVLFSGGCEKVLKAHNIPQNVTQTVGTHNEPISKVFHDNNLAITGSWDRSIRFWDLRQQTPALTLNLTNKVWAMDVFWPLVIVVQPTTTTLETHIFDMNMPNPAQPREKEASSLYHQPRQCRFFGNGKGWGIVATEGRAMIHYLNPPPNKAKFAFKSHRIEPGNNANQRGALSKVFPINSIDFHAQKGTLCTCGADGGIAFWDHENKQRLIALETSNTPVLDVRYDPSGVMLAYGLGYDWSKGHSGFTPQNAVNKAMIHPLTDEMRDPKQPASTVRRY
eukprot:Selendium_serpulae@DN6290_c0_g1_i2.p2